MPVKAIQRRSLIERVSELEAGLAEAIKTERYEDAARLRDELAEARRQAAAPAAAAATTSAIRR